MHIELENVLPGDIEKRSMEIIASELPHPIAEENADVIKRVIHTSADFDYADTLCFSPDVCAKTAELLKTGGVTIVTDTKMAWSGVSKAACKKLGVEHGGTLRGMGLLDSITEFRPEKTRTRVSGQVHTLSGLWAPLSGCTFEGYEIHMGVTTHDNEGVAVLSNGRADGAAKGAVLGSYVHGIFDQGDLAEKLISILLERKGLDADTARTVTFQEYKEQQYDILADGIRRSLDMDAVYRILERGMEE